MENVQLVQFIIIGVAVFVVLWLIADYVSNRKKKQQVVKKAFHAEQEQKASLAPKPDISPRPDVPLQTTAKKSKPAVEQRRPNTNKSAHKSHPERQPRSTPQQASTGTRSGITKKPSTVDLQNIGISQSTERAKKPTASPMSTARQAAVKTKKDLKETLPRNYNTEDLVVVFVKAPEREYFAGEKIQAFFAKYDVRPGHKKIFHRHQQDDTGAWRLVFSVANGVGDGTLMEANLTELRTRSLVFITWTRSHKPLRYFDDMMHTANQLAHELGGRLYAVNKELWTEQTTNRTREFIREKLTQLHKERAQQNTAKQ